MHIATILILPRLQTHPANVSPTIRTLHVIASKSLLDRGSADGAVLDFVFFFPFLEGGVAFNVAFVGFACHA